MTQPPGGLAPSHDTQNSRSTTEVARDEAADVARTAAQSGGDVVGTVGDQAKRVTNETTRQVRNLVEEGKGQAVEQARTGQRKAAESLHTLADQLRDMSQKSEGPGFATDLVQQAADRTRSVASWLEEHEPGDLLTEVRSFARRKPGVFLAGAALAGILAGRLTRGVVAAQSDSGADSTSGGTPRPEGSAARRPAPAPAPGSLYAEEPLPLAADPAAPGYSMPPAPPVPPPVPNPPPYVPNVPPPGTTPPGRMTP